MIESRWGSELSNEARSAADQVVDLDADETTCPACTATFNPAASPGRCPDCGLALG